MAVNNKQNCDLISNLMDFGPLGISDPLQLNIPDGLKPGTIFSITAKCENHMGILLKSNSNSIIKQINVSINKTGIFLNNQCVNENQDTQKDEQIKRRLSFICVCDTNGYKIFINGSQIKYIEDNYVNKISVLEFTDCQLFKVLYITTVFEKVNRVDDIGDERNESEVILPPAE